MPSTGPDLTETKTALREPTDAEPPAAEPSGAEPPIAGPSVAEPARAEPTGAEPARAEPTGAEPAGAEQGGAEQAGFGTCRYNLSSLNLRPRHVLSPNQPTPVAAIPRGHQSCRDHLVQPRRTHRQRLEIPPNADQGEDEDRNSKDEYDHRTVHTAPNLVPIAVGPPPEFARVVFADLGLSPEVLRAIDDMGYRHPTPIQEQAIPYVLMGRDVMGTAQTGTGKTAGFTLPMLDILSGSRARARMPRSLILEPTRELALQVAENFVQYGKYLKLTHALIIGGESMSDQKDVLNRGVDVLIATPGRLLDMFDRGTILLSDTKLLVIDEADRMLDMGFIPDVERIVSMLPATRQTLFFSATMGPEIRRLGDAFLTNPKEIAVSRAASVATTITEGLALVAEHDKREALRRLIRSQNVQNALIFCNRKRDVDILHKSLTKHHFDAGALHGDMAQTVRFSTLEKFKANELRLLVCSDVAARGLDIGGLSHVFNFDVPIHAEDYVHRIGRTGRAGLEGKAFTIASPEDRFAVEQIEKLIGHAIPPIMVEGLDPVDWAEGGRKRRGRKAPTARNRPPRRNHETPEERSKSHAPSANVPSGSCRAASAGCAEQPELAVVAEHLSHRDEPRRGVTRQNEPRQPGTKRTVRPRDVSRRPARRTGRARESLRDEGAPKPRDEPGAPRARATTEARRKPARRTARNRRDDFRRERYRRDDDLGPAVIGFGDDVPAFMFLRSRLPQMAENRETDA